MLTEIGLLIILTLLPFLELRASIPYGIIILQMNWPLVFLVCIITNIILAPIVFLIVDKFIHLFLKNKLLDKIYQKYVTKTQKKIHKYVNRWGELGVAIFIGIPLPGSGVYSGALGAYIIGMGLKRFFRSAVIGVLIAGVIVTILSVTGNVLVN